MLNKQITPTEDEIKEFIGIKIGEIVLLAEKMEVGYIIE